MKDVDIRVQSFYAYLISAEAHALLTARTYVTTLMLFQKNLDPPCNIESANAHDCVRFIEKRSAAGVSGKTIAKDMAALHAFYQFLILEQVRPDNPMQDVDAPRRAYSLPRVLSPEQVNTFLQSIPLCTPGGVRDRALFELIYAAGLRVSEAVSLSLSDIFFAERLLKVTGKGNKERMAPFGEQACYFLMQYIREARVRFTSAKHPENSEKKGAVFLNRQGGRLSRKGIWKRLQDIEIRSGVETHVHTFRHSYATHLLAGGVD